MTDSSAPGLPGIAVAMLLLTAVSFFWFPGHSILLSDTQIYIPILEHLEDPSVLTKDIMAVRPHVSFTLYDEVALALRKLTGASFEHILLAEQFLCRAAGIAGLYLIATALGLPWFAALVVAGIASLGAVVAGPTVLTVEYEPVPRGFAMPLVLLSTGAAGWKRWHLAAVAGAVTWGFHPPTTMAWWVLLLCILAWRRQWTSFAMLWAGPLLVALTWLAWPQPTPERPPLFTTIDAGLAYLQQMRASYNWVSLWFGDWWAHYTLLLAALLVALWRLWPDMRAELRVALAGLPLIGVLSVPLSYLLLEKLMWAIVPQYQPGRYVAWITLFAVLTCAAAGAKAALARRVPEAAAFFLVALIIPLSPNVAQPSVAHIGLAAGLAWVAAFLRFRPVAVAACLLPFVLLPTAGKVVNFTPADSPELQQVVEWARTSTPQDAVFLFADVRRGLQPGIFRARAKRAIYADWKAGGQVNFLHNFGDLWWERWKLAERVQPLSKYSGLGINYVIFSVAKAPKGAAPVFLNGKWAVFRTR